MLMLKVWPFQKEEINKKTKNFWSERTNTPRGNVWKYDPYKFSRAFLTLPQCSLCITAKAIRSHFAYDKIKSISIHGNKNVFHRNTMSMTPENCHRRCIFHYSIYKYFLGARSLNLTICTLYITKRYVQLILFQNKYCVLK